MNDQELVAKIIKGDMRAFKIVVQNNERLVAHMVSRLLPDKEDVQDLSQEIFIKVYKHIRNFKFQSKLSTWIGSIAYKESLNYLKKKRIAFSADYSESMEISGSEDLPDKLLSRKEISSYINQLVSQLPEHYRLVLVLYHMEDMGYEEIGQITGMPEGTVKNYLFRARKLLKDKLVNIKKDTLYESL